MERLMIALLNVIQHTASQRQTSGLHETKHWNIDALSFGCKESRKSIDSPCWSQLVSAFAGHAALLGHQQLLRPRTGQQTAVPFLVSIFFNS